MANHLAIATVTEALRLRIESAVKPIPGAHASAKRPEASDGQAPSQVTVFLYRVSPNAALRNADLPTRSADGKDVRQRPRAALDLHYLLSFAGDEQQLIPQRMLGLTVATLHSVPALSRGEIGLASEGEEWLKKSNLADEVEQVKFSMASLSVDELSKLWSVFFQTPYVLSLAYEACVVLIESDVTPREPLRVQRGGVDALPLRQPLIDHAQAAGRDDGQVIGDDTLRIEVVGQRLRGPLTLVRFDGGEPQPVTPERDTRVVVSAELSAALGAGIHGVQIVHEVLISDPPTPHRAVESNVFPFVLRPRITPTVEANAIIVEFMPMVQPGQRVRLLLNEYAAAPPADHEPRFYSLEPIHDDTEGPRKALRFPLDDVEPGIYLARAQVDGAESLIVFAPDPDAPAQQRRTPQVTIP